LVTPGPGKVGVVANPNVNQGFTNGGSVPAGGGNGAAAGFSHIYMQPNEHIEILLADAEDFVSGLPTSKHYTDKTLRSLSLQMRRLWESHFRRLYPEFARYVAGVEALELADDPKKRVRITKKTAQAAANKLLKGWKIDSEELAKLAEKSRDIIRRMVDRGTKIDQKKARVDAELDSDRYDSFLNEQTGRLIKFTDKTFKDQMRDFLVNEIQEGNGPKEIGDNITAHFESIPSSRADRIARSETRDAVNAATLLSGEAAGIRYVRATDGEDFDADCKDRNGKLFTVREAWKELRKEHPNGTLGFDLIPRANFSIEYVEEMPEGAPDDSFAYFDDESSTAFILFNTAGTEEYLTELGSWLSTHPYQNGASNEAATN
jgi:hypothetical protein